MGELSEMKRERDQLRLALIDMTNAFKPFTSRPMGGPNSLARLEQEDQIRVHATAIALLRAKEASNG